MKQYIIKRRSDDNWKNVPFLSVDTFPWFYTEGVSMRMQISWDEDALYVHQEAVEPSIRASYQEHLSPVCRDSCMEFFIAPSEGDGRYLNFEVNPNGALMLGFGFGREDRIELRPKNPTVLFDISTSRGEKSWEVSYRIPVTFLQTLFPGFYLRKGMVFKGNAYKCGDQTDHVHYITWNDMTSGKPDYHRYCDFGIMILGS